MSQGRRIAESSTALLFGNVANKITGFFVMLTVVRLLGVERFGLYTTVFAFVSVFGLITDLGLTTVVTRRLSQNAEEGRLWLGTSLWLQWPLAIFSYIACVCSALVLYGNSERTWLIAISALSFLLSPYSTYRAIFQSHLMLRIPTTVRLTTQLILLIAVQWLARTGGTLTTLVTLEVVLGGLNSVVVWLWSRRLTRPIWSFNWTFARTLLWESLPLFLTAAFISLYFRIDVFFIDHYRGRLEVSSYAAAYRLTEAMPLIATAVAGSIFPVFCQHVHTANEASLAKLVRISLKILLGIGVALAIVLSFYSRTVIAALYGELFPESAPLLAILVCSQMFVYTNILLTNLLVARGRTRTFMYLSLAMLIWNLLLNILIIPRYGALGAAWTTLATELAGTLGCLIITSTGWVFLQTIGRLAIPAFGCAALLAFFAPEGVDLTVRAILPGAAVLLIYALAVALFHVFDPEERERLRRLAWQ